MRDFNTLNPEEKVYLKLSVTAKQAAILQQEARTRGFTMSAYMGFFLQEMIDKLVSSQTTVSSNK